MKSVVIIILTTYSNTAVISIKPGKLSKDTIWMIFHYVFFIVIFDNIQNDFFHFFPFGHFRKTDCF